MMTRPHAGRGRFTAWILVALLAIYLLFIGGAWYGIYLSTLRIVSICLAAAVLITWGVIAWRQPFWRPRSALLPAIVACLISLGISTLFSRYPRVSLEYLGYSIVLAALYLLFVRLLSHDFFRPRLLALASLAFAFISAAFVFLVFRHWIDWWTDIGGLAIPPLRPEFEGLTYGNPSAVMTIAVLLGAVTAAAISVRGRFRMILLGLTLLGIVAVTILSGSRAGWFALGGTVVLAMSASLLSPSIRRRLQRAWSTILALPRKVVVIGSALTLVVGIVLAPTALRRATETGAEVRATYSVVALRLFGQAPLVGTGPGTWVIQRVRGTEAPERDYYIPHAHNLETQTLAELGLVGAIAGVVLFVSIGRLIHRSLQSENSMHRRFAVAGGLALIYFVLHQLLDFYPNMPSILFAASIPVAYMDATLPESGRPSVGPSVRRALYAAAALVVGASCVGLIAQEVPALAEDRAVSLANRGLWQEASGDAEFAVSHDPDIAPYRWTAGLVADRAGDHKTAAADFASVVATDDLPEAWLNLAAQQAEVGNTDAALQSVDSALRLGYQRVAISMAAGDLALRLGDRTRALNAFAGSILRSPSLAADPWWGADQSRAALFPEVRAAAESLMAPGDRWQLPLMMGEAPRAHALARDQGAPPYAPLVVDAWLGDKQAEDALQLRCRTTPLDLVQLLWCARLAAHDGDAERAGALAAAANSIEGGSFAFAGELRVARSDTAGQNWFGDPATFWGPFTYRRFTPWDMLVPSLVHLTLT